MEETASPACNPLVLDDCNTGDLFQLEELDLQANREGQVSRYQHRLSSDIEKTAELSELSRLREALERVEEENRTLKTSYSELLKKRAQASSQKVTTASKIVATLQKELKEKTILCQSLADKMTSYRKKYKMMKQLVKDTQIAEAEPKRAEGPYESLKSRAMEVCLNSNEMLNAIVRLQGILREVPNTHPTRSTSIMDDEQISRTENTPTAELEQSEVNELEGKLGKRTPVHLIESQTGTEQTLETSVVKKLHFEEPVVTQEMNQEARKEQSDDCQQKDSPFVEKKAVISYGNTEDEESSLSSEKSEDLGYIQMKAEQIQKDWNLAKEVPSFGSISMPTFLKKTPSTELSQPMMEEIIANKPTQPSNNLLRSKAPRQHSQEDSVEEKTQNNSKKGFYGDVWAFISKVHRKNLDTETIQTEFFDVVKSFLEASHGNTDRNSKVNLQNLLLQQKKPTKEYSVKEVLSIANQQSNFEFAKSLNRDDSHYTELATQCILYLIAQSANWQLTSEQQLLLTNLTEFCNSEQILHTKWMKLAEIMEGAKQKNKRPSQKHHFALIGVVFQQLIYCLERQIVQYSTEDHFSSHLLAQKHSFGDLKDSCHYVVEKMSRSGVTFPYIDGLEDLLLALRLVFKMSKSFDMVFNKNWYEGLRGLFANKKYRNTSQQVVGCIIFKLMNSV